MKCKVNEKTGKIGLVVLFTVLLAVAVYWTDNGNQLQVNEEGEVVLSRNGSGDGDQTEELLVSADGEWQEISVEVEAQIYDETEVKEQLAKAKEQLETLVLGENESLDEVRFDLNLPAKIPGTAVQASWELDRYDVLTGQGTLKEENIPAEGVPVVVKALLSCQETQEEYSFGVRVYPPEPEAGEQWLTWLQQQIAKLNESTKAGETFLLPSQVEGITLQWKYRTNFRAVWILLLGAMGVVFLLLSRKEKEKEVVRKKHTQMLLAYPQILSKLTLFLNAGMSIRNAWKQMVSDYEKEKENTGEKLVYEEMKKTIYELDSKVPEDMCYERFGNRCGLKEYRKLGILLAQNLKKGTRGLTELLRQETTNAFEERKMLAKRLGEEAGTKLMLPMLFMLGVVLLIIVFPAFSSMQL